MFDKFFSATKFTNQQHNNKKCSHSCALRAYFSYKVIASFDYLIKFPSWYMDSCSVRVCTRFFFARSFLSLIIFEASASLKRCCEMRCTTNFVMCQSNKCTLTSPSPLPTLSQSLPIPRHTFLPLHTIIYFLVPFPIFPLPSASFSLMLPFFGIILCAHKNKHIYNMYPQFIDVDNEQFCTSIHLICVAHN